MFTQYDLEYLVIFAILGILFCSGLKPIRGGQFRPFVIDKPMSQALKGIACIFILMGHWGQRKFDIDMPWGISKVVWQTTANIALTWFMFFSGYGMSLKRIKCGECLGKWWQSIKKIFIPCLLTCLVFLVICAILPDKYTPEQVSQLWLPKQIHMLHHLDMPTMVDLIPSLLGGGDWYVYCILMFYTIYYVATFLSDKFHWNQTLLLGIFFVAYWFGAYFYFGPPQGHYYRYVWTFMLGHAVAQRTRLSWAAVAILLMPALKEGMIMKFDFLMGVIALYILSFVNSKYEMKGKAILWLGTISYFFYLAHIRIGYTLLTYLGINSIILWMVITALVSYLLYELNSKIKIL